MYGPIAEASIKDLEIKGNKAIIGASLSEPHTSESNGGFFIYTRLKKALKRFKKM